MKYGGGREIFIREIEVLCAMRSRGDRLAKVFSIGITSLSFQFIDLIGLKMIWDFRTRERICSSLMPIHTRIHRVNGTTDPAVSESQTVDDQSALVVAAVTFIDRHSSQFSVSLS